MLFEPAEPVKVLGLIEVQGLFGSRQIEVSDEFGDCKFFGKYRFGADGYGL